jgi:transcriptional regulator with XRE-family HTH domain
MENIKWMTDSAILKRIGEHIKEWRLEMNLTQVHLADKTQLSIATIFQIESGNGTSLHNLIKVLRILDRLDALSQFLQEKEISPLEFQKLESGIKNRKRASKTKSNDTDNNGSSLW